MRALHAALVILIRHGLGLSANDGAQGFDVDGPELKTIKDYLLEIVRRVDPYEAVATSTHLDQIAYEWAAWRDEAIGEGKALYYRASGRQTHRILKDFGAAGQGWPTLHSMRNVDRNSPIHVLGEDRFTVRRRA
jgi:hypothetical protein